MCHDGQQLLQHWRDGGAVVGARASSYKLVLKGWRSIHYDSVAVIGGESAHKYWRCVECKLSLCQCLPFALSGRCEHEQYISALVAGNLASLHIVGRRGRKCTLPSFTPRGVSSNIVLGGQASSQSSEDPLVKQQLATASAPLQGLIDTVGTRSDASTGKMASCLREGQQQVHAPRLYATDFGLVEKVLMENGVELSPNTGIYWTEAQQAWKAVYRGEYVQGSHASFKRFNTHAEAILHDVRAATSHHQNELRLSAGLL